MKVSKLKQFNKPILYRIGLSIKKKFIYANNRYKLTLPTKMFIFVISVIALLNSPLIPGGIGLNLFLDKILGKIL